MKLRVMKRKFLWKIYIIQFIFDSGIEHFSLICLSSTQLIDIRLNWEICLLNKLDDECFSKENAKLSTIKEKRKNMIFQGKWATVRFRRKMNGYLISNKMSNYIFSKEIEFTTYFPRKMNNWSFFQGKWFILYLQKESSQI